MTQVPPSLDLGDPSLPGPRGSLSPQQLLMLSRIRVDYALILFPKWHVLHTTCSEHSSPASLLQTPQALCLSGPQWSCCILIPLQELKF